MTDGAPIPTHVGAMKHRIRLSMRRGAHQRTHKSIDLGIRLLVVDMTDDRVLACETLWCGRAWDERATNTMGQPGAYAAVWPDDAEVARVANRLIDQHGVTEQRDLRLHAMGVPMLEIVRTETDG